MAIILQRSSVSFRRRGGSSGRIWDDQLLLREMKPCENNFEDEHIISPPPPISESEEQPSVPSSPSESEREDQKRGFAAIMSGLSSPIPFDPCVDCLKQFMAVVCDAKVKVLLEMYLVFYYSIVHEDTNCANYTITTACE